MPPPRGLLQAGGRGERDVDENGKADGQPDHRAPTCRTKPAHELIVIHGDLLRASGQEGQTRTTPLAVQVPCTGIAVAVVAAMRRSGRSSATR